MKLILNLLLMMLITMSCLNQPEKNEAKPENGLDSDKLRVGVNECIRSRPEVSLNPSTLSLTPGEEQNLILTINDNNNLRCGKTNYNLEAINLPAGVISNLVGNITLAPQGSFQISFALSASEAASVVNNHNVSFKASDVRDPKLYSASQELSLTITAEEHNFSLVSAAAENITQTSADIKFILSENATGKIEYGTTTALGTFTPEETSFNYAEHVQSLSDLQTGTTYYYKIYASTQGGLSLVSDIFDFTTQPATPTCIRANPSLTVNPTNFNGNEGDSFNFTISITNNNQYCAQTSYQLSFVNLPSGFNSNMPANQELNSGAVTNISVAMSSGSEGVYNFNLKAIDNSSSSHLTTTSLSFVINADNSPPPSEDLVYPPSVLLSEISYPEYQVPTGAIPGYLEAFADDIHGYSVKRVSDHDFFGFSYSSTSSWRLRHRYAKNQVWNSDGTLIRLAGPTAALLDGNTYELIKWMSSAPTMGSWSSIDPKKIYSVQSNNFVSYNVDSESTTVLRTFSQYSSISFGEGEGNISNDDRYIGLVGRAGCGRVLFVYDILNNQILGSKDIGCSGDMDWFSVSQLGNFAVVQWHDNGNGTTQGIKSYNLNMTNEIHVHDMTGHGDIGIDQEGNEVVVEYRDKNDHSLFMARLDGEGTTLLMPYVDGQGIWGGHISTRNINRPGWAYVSEQCCSEGSRNSASEVFAIKLDGSGTIQRFGKHHNKQRGNSGNSNSEQYHSAMAVPNQNGTKVMFASNWRHEDYLNAFSPPAWVLEVTQD